MLIQELRAHLNGIAKRLATIKDGNKIRAILDNFKEDKEISRVETDFLDKLELKHIGILN
jgi:hypothetical protein